jgi:hypothetical protein
MARVRLNSFLNGVSGKLGNYAFRRHRGRTVMQRLPRCALLRSHGQRQTSRTFRGGADFALVVRANPTLYALYREFGRRKKLSYRHMAISDAFDPPRVEELLRRAYSSECGGELGVRAFDRFGVARVAFVLRDATGAILLYGDGAQRADGTDRDAWYFHVPPPAPGSNRATSVTITAFDRPGNFAVQTFPLT